MKKRYPFVKLFVIVTLIIISGFLINKAYINYNSLRLYENSFDNADLKIETSYVNKEEEILIVSDEEPEPVSISYYTDEKVFFNALGLSNLRVFKPDLSNDYKFSGIGQVMYSLSDKNPEKISYMIDDKNPNRTIPDNELYKQHAKTYSHSIHNGEKKQVISVTSGLMESDFTSSYQSISEILKSNEPVKEERHHNLFDESFFINDNDKSLYFIGIYDLSIPVTYYRDGSLDKKEYTKGYYCLSVDNANNKYSNSKINKNILEYAVDNLKEILPN